MKKNKRTYRAEIIIVKGRKKLPDFGLGPGVIGVCDYTFTDAMGLGFDSPLFAAQLELQGRELVKKVVKVRWTPVKHKSKRGINDRRIG